MSIFIGCVCVRESGVLGFREEGGEGRMKCLMLTVLGMGRVESYGSDYEFVGVFVYGVGGVGRGEEGYWER